MTPFRRIGLCLLTVFAVPALSASGQNVTEWSAESRLALSFHVNDAALQRLLPPG